MFEDAFPAKKRYRTPFLEWKEMDDENIIDQIAQKSEPANVTVGMVVVSQKDQLPDRGRNLESQLLRPASSDLNKRIAVDKKRIGKW